MKTLNKLKQQRMAVRGKVSPVRRLTFTLPKEIAREPLLESGKVLLDVATIVIEVLLVDIVGIHQDAEITPQGVLLVEITLLVVLPPEDTLLVDELAQNEMAFI
jgi:hypothetical protein